MCSLSLQVLVQVVVGFVLVLLGLLYNLKLRYVRTGSDIKGKSFTETFAENDYTVFTGRKKELAKLSSRNSKK